MKCLLLNKILFRSLAFSSRARVNRSSDSLKAFSSFLSASRSARRSEIVFYSDHHGILIVYFFFFFPGRVVIRADPTSPGCCCARSRNRRDRKESGTCRIPRLTIPEPSRGMSLTFRRLNRFGLKFMWAPAPEDGSEPGPAFVRISSGRITPAGGVSERNTEQFGAIDGK